MINLLTGKSKSQGAAEALIAFVRSLDMHGSDDTAICSGVLDVVRAYMGERPCCVWRAQDARLEKVSERGMVEIFFSTDKEEHQAALARALASGSSEFDPCQLSSRLPELKNGFDGFLHIPIKTQDEVLGIFTLAVLKKESRDVSMVQPLECLGKLIAMALQTSQTQNALEQREKKLKAEVQATTRELEQTNKKLIERVRELKMLYKELQKRVQELTQANRAKNEFLSIVSHELRTPLTSLTGFLCVLLEEEAGPINDQQRKFLTITKQSAVRLNLLISDLLDISRIESGRLNLEMDVFSLHQLVLRCVEGLKSPAANKGLELVYSGPDQLPDSWGDATRLQQVIDNLIANAIKFTDRGGTITVTAAEKGDFLVVGVKDSGIGLSAEDQEKIFDMFYQADASMRRSAGGAGLGLAIARGIVTMHGGQLWVESELGKGATFSFMIPIKKNQSAAA